MYQPLVLMSFFGPILVTGKIICSGQNWLLFGTTCYKIGDTLDYQAATSACNDLDGYIMMPKTTEEMEFAKSLQNIHGTIEEVWIGLKENHSDGIWKWADGSASNQKIVEGSFVEEDCVRLHTSGLVYDTVCSSIYVTICQRDADLETTSIIDMTSSAEIITTNQKTSEDPTTIEADLFRTTSAHLSTNTDTSVESSTSYKMQLPETTSIMAISSSPELTTTTQITVEDHTTIEPELSDTTSAHSSTNTETSVESLTAYSVSSRSHAPKVLSTLSSVISTNSTQHCTHIYVSICSNQSNSTSRSAGYTYKVDTKKLSSYKRKHQSASDPRKSSMFIGSVGIAVLVSVVLLIMFLDCVPTKDRHPFSTTDIRVRKCLKTINSECLCFLK